MVQVNTYISNPDYGPDQLDVPLVYNIKDKFVTSTNGLDYDYTTIHDGKTLFEGSMEVIAGILVYCPANNRQCI